jgi:hypothetical protein
MLWWVLIAIVVVALLALAWWTSGRSTKPTRPGMDSSRMQGEVSQRHGPGGDPTHQGGFAG